MDDQKNDQPIFHFFERHFFSAVQSADCQHGRSGLECHNIRGGFDAVKWQNLISQMWRLKGRSGGLDWGDCLILIYFDCL